jgi:hypothetical protein
MFFVVGYPGHSVKAIGWKELTHIMMVAMCNLHVEYGHCTEKQMYEYVLNNVVKVTNSFRVSFAIPSIAIKIMEDIASFDDRNINNYPRLNEFMNVLLLLLQLLCLLPINRDFYVLFKQWEWNPHYSIYQ